MTQYDHAQVQEFWQYVWERDDVYAAADDPDDPVYVLGMFPYTSGSLHMGHVRNYAITDAYARYRRMQGDDVLHPMGWDAFGLPAENAALERHSDPQSWTEACIARMRDELRTSGFGYDWSREIRTCDPSYYRWNQWLFAQLYEAGLVEHKAATVNWCPDCETVLADAQVDERPDGRVCWRCETPVGRRDLDQWFFTITDYAEELHDGLEDLEDWPEGVREIQRNWIGRQEGATITFEVETVGPVEVFTTRPDTVFGASYLALAPGHEAASEIAATDEDVAQFLEEARSTDPTARGQAGIDTGLTATHPLTGEPLPVYVAGYVLADVGTGAVMGVPAHNERDHAFARQHDLPLESVVTVESDDPPLPYTGEGTLTDSGQYSGQATEAARAALLETDDVERSVTYRLRDWLISRQRYWGTPIPIVHCPDCGDVLVPEEELPIELPEFVHTTGNPLAETDSFVQTTCPECGGPAERETDTMDTFVDSSWYYLRYLSPALADAPFDSELAESWLPVDVYVGGEEHATLHLLYLRFFARALTDLGLLDEREPVEQLVSQGTVLYDGEKMSASKGNVVDPDEYGAETTRLFVLSAAHPAQDFEWTANNVRAAYELQQDLYALVTEYVEQPPGAEPTDRDAYVEGEIDRTIAAVTEELERFRFHRAVAEIRELATLLRRYRSIGAAKPTDRRGLLTIAALVSPFAPHLGEELWNKLRGEGLVVQADWPTPSRDVSRYREERRLVEDTRDDVRDIVDTADIQAPDTVELVVAPDWQYDAIEAVEAHGHDGNAVAEAIDRPPELVGPFVSGLTAERASPLEPDEELELLEAASWLLEDEFDVAVRVRQAPEDGDLADRASPGKPAIRVE